MRTDSGVSSLWPPGEAFEAIASILTQHWRAAAKTGAARLFWQAPPSWLRTAPVRAPLQTVTTSPPAAGSSGKPPDPHRY
jgi:hypothetical protein